MDPWKLASAAPAADVILITHEHSDHFSPDDIARILSSRTLIVGPASVTKGLADAGAVTMMAGETITAGTATITAVPAHNIDKVRPSGVLCHPPEAGGLGYLVELDGRRVYHAGDTE